MLKRSQNKYHIGDTMVEVLFSIVVFSVLAVSTMSIMNKGIAISQRSLEITMARNEIKSQAEIIKMLNTSYIAYYDASNNSSSQGFKNYPLASEWAYISSMATNNKDNLTNISLTSSNTCPELPLSNKTFILNPQNASLATLTRGTNYISSNELTSYAQVSSVNDNVQARGIWIEPKSTYDASNGRKNVDFYIHACWDAPDSSIPISLGTVVRLYEPY